MLCVCSFSDGYFLFLVIFVCNKLFTHFEKEDIILKEFCDVLEQELNYSAIQKIVRIQVDSGLFVANQVSKNYIDLRRGST